jgi:hypothetical protein
VLRHGAFAGNSKLQRAGGIGGGNFRAVRGDGGGMQPALDVTDAPRAQARGEEDDNGRRARAAVMRHGCRRGECFEGYEPRCGERHAAARPVGARAFGSTKQLVRGRCRETQRTLSGPDCNTSGPPDGANRRGGGNPRGRNTMRSGWSRRTEGRRQRQPGVDIGRFNRRQGKTRAKPRRGGSGD